MIDLFSLGMAKIVPAAKYESVLLYGGPGSGKTHFALTASLLEEFSPMLVVDTENSTSGVIDKFRQRDPNNPEDIAFDPEKGGIVDVVRPYELWGHEAFENTMSLLDEVANGNTIYKSVVIDVADVLQEWGLNYYENPKDSWAKWAKIDKALTSAPLPDNTEGGTESKGVFYRLKMSGVLTFLVVHEKRTPAKDDEPEVINYQWGGAGKGKIGGIPDAVLYFKRRAKNGGAETQIHTIGSNFEAKNRFDLPNIMKNATFPDIYELSKKGKQ